MKLAVGHSARINQFLAQRPNLQSAEHVRGLIEWAVTAVHRPPDFRRGIAAFVSDPIDQKIDRLGRRQHQEPPSVALAVVVCSIEPQPGITSLV